MNNIDFEIGAILLGENNHPKDGNNHYIVFFEHLDGSDFVGAMISTKPFKNINLPMKDLHFEIVDGQSKKKWQISYFNSHLVPAKLHKFNLMGPFEKVGQLTKEGVSFLSEVINDTELMSWEQYLKSLEIKKTI